ncbi:MAG TPA: HAMP domain-containing sensor histidine kinase [Halomicronema sp.]
MNDFSKPKKTRRTKDSASHETINPDCLDQLCNELRTPLASMKMWVIFLEAALEKEDLFNLEKSEASQSLPLQEKLIYYLEKLKHHCDEQLHLINNFLELQRLENQSEPLILTKIKLQDWIPYILEILDIKDLNNIQRFQTEISPELPIIFSDIYYLERILIELLKHACNCTPPTTKITLSASKNEEKISLKVSYIPFPYQVGNNIYPFPQNTETCNNTIDGFPLVKKLANYIGGSISVNNNPDITHLTLELPIKI